jgi:hypothetical protein
MNEIAMAELGEIARIRDESTIRGVPEPEFTLNSMIIPLTASK